MSQLSAPPPERQRPRIAIERVMDDATEERFDPREVIGSRLVLTLPLEEAGRAPAPSPRGFQPN
jgi:hypothetical protein